MLHERSAQIMELLIYSDKPVAPKELANRFGVSLRSIQYDLGKINDYLRRNRYPQLYRESGASVQLNVDEPTRQKLLQHLGRIDYQRVLSPMQRQKSLIFLLMEAEGYLTIDQLAERLMVSRCTIINDIRAARKLIAPFHVVLEGRSNYGLRLKAKEQDIRRLALALADESNWQLATPFALKLIDIMERIETDRLAAGIVLKDIDLDTIEEAIRFAEQRLHISLADRPFLNLKFHLAFSIRRLRKGHSITMSQADFSQLERTEEYLVASQMISRLEQAFDVAIPKDEVAFVTVYLLGGRTLDYKAKPYLSAVQLQLLTHNLISSMRQQLGNDFAIDEELYTGLEKHLKSTLYRLRYGLPLDNIMLDDIEAQYPEIMESAVNACRLIEEFIGYKVPREEAGFIAIHFAAARERFLRSGAKYRVLVVCSSGVGTSMMLAARLEKALPNIQVIDIVSASEVQSEERRLIPDLIVSTLQVAGSATPQVMVNALLPQEDIAKINSVLLGLKPKTRTEKTADEDPLAQFVKRYAQPGQAAAMEQDLRYLLKHIHDNSCKGNKTLMMKDLITEKTLQLQCRASHWEQALNIAAQPLLESGAITAAYVQAALETSQKMGDYIIIAPGVAMPHARPDDGVSRICMSLTTLEKPVTLTKEKDVDVILFFGAIDRYSHTDALSDLMKLLLRKGAIETIRNSTKKEEVLALIRDISNMNNKELNEQN